jgi:hypothetical protein
LSLCWVDVVSFPVDADRCCCLYLQMEHPSHVPLTLCSKQAIYIAVYIVFGASHAILIKATATNGRDLPYNPVSGWCTPSLSPLLHHGFS